MLEGSAIPLPVTNAPRQDSSRDVRTSGSSPSMAWNLTKLDTPIRGPTPSSPSNTGTDHEAISTSDVYVETRMFKSSLSVASSSTTSGVSSGLGTRVTRSPPVHDRTASGTPTWTHSEGTPSFTESSDSGDLGKLRN